MRLKPRHRYPTSSCVNKNGFPRKLLWFGIVGTKGHKITTRWASTSYKWGYNSYESRVKKPYSPMLFKPLKGVSVLTSFTIARGPPCKNYAWMVWLWKKRVVKQMAFRRVVDCGIPQGSERKHPGCLDSSCHFFKLIFQSRHEKLKYNFLQLVKFREWYANWLNGWLNPVLLKKNDENPPSNLRKRMPLLPVQPRFEMNADPRIDRISCHQRVRSQTNNREFLGFLAANENPKNFWWTRNGE